jgi:hypothetical protein
MDVSRHKSVEMLRRYVKDADAFNNHTGKARHPLQQRGLTQCASNSIKIAMLRNAQFRLRQYRRG